MRRVSRKRAAENRQRRKILAALADNHDGICPRCHTEPIADGHELLSRARGGSITDPDNIVLIGRRCHDWITTHPVEAEAEGWALSQFGGAA